MLKKNNMKKIRIGLMAIAALTGISGAFAFNSPKKVVGTTYYGYKDANGDARWATTPPAFTNCGATDNALACTITSTSTNVTNLVNQFPAQHTVIGGEDQLYR